ncbi:MAG TPA: HAD-IA family hydrolase [Candidatus Saccharimonadales bacterium]|jgi:2-haloacid dehalogenase|nr:HAD-IA family hydrolase [Candidatus Saccharimonadales bacterium]
MDFTQVRLITFDCYGTLIDWESGMLRSMRPLFVGASDEELLKMYSEIEPEFQSGGYLPYRRVLAEAVKEIGKRLERPVTDAEAQAFAESLKQWQPFPDTVAALQSLSRRCKLAIVSNIDDDLFAATREHLKTDFMFVVTAQQVGSYKPALNHFHEAIKRAGLASISKEQVLHAAESLHHDIAPANSLGLKNVWVNRRFGKPGAGATRGSAATPMLEVRGLDELQRLLAANSRE